MTDETTRIRPALTEQEQKLLDLVRAGKVDAEIAVRLGISNAEVKARVERLRWKLRARDRDELRNSEAAMPSEAAEVVPERRRGRFVTALAALAVLVFGAGAAAGWLIRDEDDSRAAAALETPSAPSPAPAVPLLTPTVYSTQIAGRQMQLLGQPFEARPPLEFTADNRETLLVLRFAQPVVLQYGELPGARLAGGGSNGVVLTVEQPQRAFSLFVLVESGQVVYGDDNSVTLTGSDHRGPTALVYARAPEGPAHYHLELDVAGRLYVSSQAVPANIPVAFDTGQLLDASNVFPMGETTPNDHWILCGEEDGAPCTSLLRGDLVPTGPGSLTCDAEAGVLTFTSTGESGATLLMKWESDPRLVCREASREVRGGEALGYGGLHTVSAIGRDGTPLSVLITRHGVVYISAQLPTATCPCRTGT